MNASEWRWFHRDFSLRNKVDRYGLDHEMFVRAIDVAMSMEEGIHRYDEDKNARFLSRMHDQIAKRSKKKVKEPPSGETIIVQKYVVSTQQYECDFHVYRICMCLALLSRKWRHGMTSVAEVPGFLVEALAGEMPSLLPFVRVRPGEYEINPMWMADYNDHNELVRRRNWFARRMCGLFVTCVDVACPDGCFQGDHWDQSSRCRCEELFHVTMLGILGPDPARRPGEHNHLSNGLRNKMKTYAQDHADLLKKAEVALYAFCKAAPNYQRLQDFHPIFSPVEEEEAFLDEAETFAEKIDGHARTLNLSKILPVDSCFDTLSESVIFDPYLQRTKWKFRKYKVLPPAKAMGNYLEATGFLPEATRLYVYLKSIPPSKRQNYLCLHFQGRGYPFRMVYENAIRQSSAMIMLKRPLVMDSPTDAGTYVILHFSLLSTMRDLNLGFVAERRLRFPSRIMMFPFLLRAWYRQPLYLDEGEDPKLRSLVCNLTRQSVIRTLMAWMVSQRSTYCLSRYMVEPMERDFEIYDLLPRIVSRWTTARDIELEFVEVYKKLREEEEAGKKSASTSKKKRKTGKAQYDPVKLPDQSIFDVIIGFFMVRASKMISNWVFSQIKAVVAGEYHGPDVNPFVVEDAAEQIKERYPDMRAFFLNKRTGCTSHHSAFTVECYVTLEWDEVVVVEEDQEEDEDISKKNLTLIWQIYDFLSSDLIHPHLSRKWLKRMYPVDRMHMLETDFVHKEKRYSRPKLTPVTSKMLEEYHKHYAFEEEGELRVQNELLPEFIPSSGKTYEDAWMDIDGVCSDENVKRFVSVYIRNTSYHPYRGSDVEKKHAHHFQRFMSTLEWCGFFYHDFILPEPVKEAIKPPKERKRKRRYSLCESQRLIQNGCMCGPCLFDPKDLLSEKETCWYAIRYKRPRIEQSGVKISQAVYLEEGMLVCQDTRPRSDHTRTFNPPDEEDDPWLFENSPSHASTEELSDASRQSLMNIVSMYYGTNLDRFMDSYGISKCFQTIAREASSSCFV